MDTVIKKDGIYYNNEKVEESNIVSKLKYFCVIDEDVTLGDIFKIVESLPLLKMIIAQYSTCYNINEFHEEALLEEKVEQNDEPLSRLEIEWIADFSNFSKKEFNELVFSPEILAYGPTTQYHKDNGVNTEEMKYGISFVPMYELAKLKISLNEVVEVQELFGENPNKVLFKFIKPFAIIDVLDAIYEEISFYGSPKKRNLQSQEMKQIVQDIKDGKVDTIPFEDIDNKLARI